MGKNIKLEIADYVSIANYKHFHTIEHLDGLEKLTEIISLLSGIDKEEINQWSPTSIVNVSDKLTNIITEQKNEFYPILEIDGVKYGYTSLTDMTLGEYIDLERLCKDTLNNLEEIMAILYRPIINHRFNSLGFKIKHGIKIKTNDIENIFNYYTTEPYDNKARVVNSQVFKNIPISFANGALSFFLATATNCLIDLKDYSNPVIKTAQQKVAMGLLANIGDGSKLFTNLLLHPSLTSQETKESPILTSCSPSTTSVMNRIWNKKLIKQEN